MVRALVLCVALASGVALAQDDDDLPALQTGKPKPKPTPPRPRPRPVAPKPKPAPAPAASNDDDLPPLAQAKGELVIKLGANAKGAKLTIDDRDIGMLPQPGQVLVAGEHAISVHRLGYTWFNKRVTIVGNKTNEISVVLEASSAVVSVNSDVAGSQVFVNGRMAGSAPLVDLEVPPGNVEISVKKDGYRDGTQQVLVKAGREYPIEVKLGAPIATAIVTSDAPLVNDLAPHGATDVGLSETPGVTSSAPVYQRWWFWTAIVLVAAGVAVATILGLDLSQPKTIAITQGAVCPTGCDQWINKPSAIVPLKF
jgi:hypothetical protein